MNADVYAALLTAGNNLQPIGDRVLDFLITFGPGLALAFAGWLALWAWDKSAPWLTARRIRRREIRELKRLYMQPYKNPTRRSRKEKP